MPTISKAKTIFKALPTRERLLELFEFDAETGVMHWKPRTSGKRCASWNAKNAGKVAGWILADGRRSISIDGETWLAYRLVFVLAYGYDPQTEIDHWDGDCTNDTPSNLRPATRLQQSANMPVRCDNKQLLKGVGVCGKRFRATITVAGAKNYLGTFDTPEAAHAAYCEAAQRLHGKFARTE